MAETKLSHSESQAAAQLESIREMVAALECDYDRLEELRDERDSYDPEDVEASEPCHCPECNSGSYEATPVSNGNDLMTCAECGSKWLEDDNGNKFPLSWDQANRDEAGELAELERDAGDCADREHAEQRIQEDPLSVEVCSEKDVEPAEYCILLCTGGPACRIRGELDRGEPTSARLEHQDWGTPWTEWRISSEDEETLLTYARCFYYAE